MARGATSVAVGYLQPGHIYFRYQLVTLGFVLLAVVPTRPVQWRSRSPLASHPARLTMAAGVLLVVTSIGATAIRDQVDESARAHVRRGTIARQAVGDLYREPEGQLEESTWPGWIFFRLSRDEVRSLLERYGLP